MHSSFAFDPVSRASRDFLFSLLGGGVMATILFFAVYVSYITRTNAVNTNASKTQEFKVVSFERVGDGSNTHTQKPKDNTATGLQQVSAKNTPQSIPFTDYKSTQNSYLGPILFTLTIMIAAFAGIFAFEEMRHKAKA